MWKDEQLYKIQHLQFHKFSREWTNLRSAYVKAAKGESVDSSEDRCSVVYAGLTNALEVSARPLIFACLESVRTIHTHTDA